MESFIVILLVVTAVVFIAVKKLPLFRAMTGDPKGACKSCQGCPFSDGCGVSSRAHEATKEPHEP